MAGIEGYDLSQAVEYHYGKFPPQGLRYERLVLSLAAATGALARYDAKLEKLHNKELLLAPLRNAEAVVSSRIEGTVATLDEILKIEADADDDDGGANHRQEAIEVYSYTRAVKLAQQRLNEGLPISSRLIREAHSRLLFFGRGADKTPGEFKKDQNYVVDKRNRRILFVPASPEYLNGAGMSAFENYVNDPAVEPLIQTAVLHVEFEALHPFKDGNGRLGRMLVPLNLWQRQVIHAPHFYISSAVEERREEYVDRLREVSEKGAWDEWILFFLEILRRQAEINMDITDRISELYDYMSGVFRETLRSQWAPVALDYVFTRPVFRNSAFTAGSGIPSQTAHRISRTLLENEILTQVEPASGRRAALLAFMPLMEIVRT